jgi:hypothetical protein
MISQKYAARPDPLCQKCNGLGAFAWVTKYHVGLVKSIPEYIEKLLTIFSEIKRVLKKTGSCWIVMGDTFTNKSLAMIPPRFAIAMTGGDCIFLTVASYVF